MNEKIVIVGAGFAGMWSAFAAARALDGAGRADGSVAIEVIAPEPALHLRPRFYEPDPATMQAPLGPLFECTGVRYRRGSVARIDPRAGLVCGADDGGSSFEVGFDRLVLASGSRLFRPEIPGLREHAHSIDLLAEAAAFEDHLRALATAPRTEGRNRIVVGGGGFTGIEAATDLPARLRAMHGEEFEVVLVEQANEIGPDLGPGPRPVIRQALEAAGVVCRLGESITGVDADGVSTSSGARIAAKTVLWTAGLRASSLAAQVQAERGPLGRLRVARDLRVIGADRVFACGDVAFAATDDLGNHALMSCQHAMNMGRSAGHNAAADLLGLPTLPYAQPKYVTCLDLGPWGAVYTEGWDREVRMAGADAKALKRKINGEWIYPPRADRAEIFAAADPARVIVA